MAPGSTYVAADGLGTFAAEVFARLGLPSDDADRVADCLLTADLRGIGSHGVSRVPIYAERLRRGLVNPTPSFAVERGGATAAVDGDNAMGAVVGTRAMSEAIALADAHGAAAVTVRHGNHFGIASYFAMQALERDCIGLAMANTAPAMAPWGGRQRFFGTNPLAAAAPAGAQPAIVIDMATTVTARGKIRLAAQSGGTIPEGWALDADGAPTTDARAAMAGIILPFAEHKGSAIALLIEILAGVLTGAAVGDAVGDQYTNFDRPQDVGYFFVAIDVARFMPVGEFKARMDAMIDDLKGGAPAAGHERILLPGDIERDTTETRRRTGIPLSEEVVRGLGEVSESLGVPLPHTSSQPLDGSPT
jgi:LDH2 family malate/lactate/ureidoglycolate dehydrogenase